MNDKRPYKNPQYNLRIPQDLKDTLTSAADENNRSLNQEIIARLQESFEAALLKTQFDTVERNYHICLEEVAFAQTEISTRDAKIHKLEKELNEAKGSIAILKGEMDFIKTELSSGDDRMQYLAMREAAEAKPEHVTVEIYGQKYSLTPKKTPYD